MTAPIVTLEGSALESLLAAIAGRSPRRIRVTQDAAGVYYAIDGDIWTPPFTTDKDGTCQR